MTTSSLYRDIIDKLRRGVRATIPVYRHVVDRMRGGIRATISTCTDMASKGVRATIRACAHLIARLRAGNRVIVPAAYRRVLDKAGSAAPWSRSAHRYVIEKARCLFRSTIPAYRRVIDRVQASIRATIPAYRHACNWAGETVRASISAGRRITRRMHRRASVTVPLAYRYSLDCTDRILRATVVACRHVIDATHGILRVMIPYVLDTTRQGVQLTGTAYRYADDRVRTGVGVTIPYLANKLRHGVRATSTAYRSALRTAPVAYPYAIIAIIASAMLASLSLVLYQSLLSAPFSDASARFGLDSYRFIFADENFSIAFGTTLLLSAAMALIAVPLGTGLAFLMVRTDLPGRPWLEPLILLPIFIPGLVMGFGYMVALGPGGMLGEFFESSDWAATWNLYAFPSLVVIAGLAHVPYVYLYVSPAMRNLDGDAEQAARSAGAGAWKVAFDVTLPMAMPAILFATVLVFFFGFELFGLPLVLGDRQGIVVLSTYLYKLGNTLAAPPYQHMAVVIVIMAAIGLPLIFMQRALLTEMGRAVARQGKQLLFARFQLGLCRWPTFLLIALWLAILVLLPVAAIVLRSFLVAEDGGLAGWGALTLEHFQALLQHAAAARSIINTVLMGAIGGGIAVACYTALVFTVHRLPSRWAQAVDYLALIPRAIPGLAAGLVLLWALVFIKPITPLREMLVSVWLAYAVVWLACGTQFVRGRLEKLDPELEEIARTVGATQTRAGRDVTFPLLRKSVLAAWLLIFLMFVRDYSTAIYLIAPGNEIAGPLLVSLWAQNSMDLVSALSVIIIAILGTGTLIVSRLGVCPYD